MTTIKALISLLACSFFPLYIQVMLSFPAQNWQKALAPARANFLGRNPEYGRVASRINDRLYLSDQWTAKNGEKLKELGITHMISVIESRQSLPEFITEDRRLHIPVSDSSDSNILQYFDKTTDFIKRTLEEDENNKVLVHCMQGISRSATVVCAFLVATTDMTAEASIEHVQSIRGIVCPNFGFRRQLSEYSTKFVHLKRIPPQNQAALEEVSRSGGGSIAARIRSLRRFGKIEG